MVVLQIFTMTNPLTELITLSFMFDLFRRPDPEIVSLSKLYGEVYTKKILALPNKIYEGLTLLCQGKTP